MELRKMHPFFFYKDYLSFYIIVCFILLVNHSFAISIKRNYNSILFDNINLSKTNHQFYKKPDNLTLRSYKYKKPIASISSSISKKLSNRKGESEKEKKSFTEINNSKNEIKYYEKFYNNINQELNNNSSTNNFHDTKDKEKNIYIDKIKNITNLNSVPKNYEEKNIDKKNFINTENGNSRSYVDNQTKNNRITNNSNNLKNINNENIEKFKRDIFENDLMNTIADKLGFNNKKFDNNKDHMNYNNNNNNNDENNNNYNNNEDINNDNENNNENINNNNDNKDGSENDKETNFLLKALESGKFPNFCVVENIDEKIDNCEIYMNKEKMEELNISDGFTVLLKGKKKKEMLGIARVDESLKKNFVIISFAMKKNLRLMHNDIIKIYPFIKVQKIKSVLISPFSDTVGSLSRDEIENKVLKPYLKNSYKPLYVNNNIYINYKNNKVEFKILNISTEENESEECGCINEGSEINLSEEYLNREDYEEHNDDITYEDIGGMKKQLNKIRELIELPLKYPEIFMSIGISAPKGVLMHGIPGTGKTSIAKAIANESNAYCYIINGPEIMSKHIGESEQKLRKIFKKASEKTPCIIFIDEIDSIANKRSKSNNELEKRVVSQLLTLMDGLKKNNNVLVLAATNRPNSIDPALRRFGRFDREIEIPVPDEQGRYEILLTKTKKMKLDSDVNLRKIAKECHGYVGADLAQLCFEAAIQCIKEHIHFLDLDEEDFIEFMKISVDQKQKEVSNNTSDIDNNEESEKLNNKNMFMSNRNDEEKKKKKIGNFFFRKEKEKVLNEKDNSDKISDKKIDGKTKKIPSYILNKLTIKAKHFQHALNICNPSSLRERQVQIPTVTWNDIGGMNEVKEQLKETILYPLEYKHLYNKFNSNYNKGILLYGPPGCGKTLLAKAIANECKANFISVKGPELLTMWFGESEANVRDLFDKARAASPCIIFFDEIDSLAKERNSNNNNDASDRVINQILTEIDGINEKKTIFIIAATNRPDILDKALTRPGRLDKLIYISLPDLKSRYSIFKAILKNTPLNKDVDIYDMAKRTEGFSGADITNLCQSAVNEAIKETIYLLKIRKKDKYKNGKNKSDKNQENDFYDPVPTLSKKHFDLAFKNARISIQPEDVLKYENFKKKLTLQDFA
ncbi:AAA family ATPase, CDC48 subfamily, putative [Plasmodium gallinaceum]|uniref:AAA family ATPase, CDC48 subfamily, putative n=1 Tax=Plasmodium gallinaceum TaxID=5849 RepID=A0A1J1H056_PLAGA|nr:AAA family ATPase, CDC48 subfamily, putative [Plasmodium gallinaceum]CRG98076.1 AAA family ATPase, CDC48 subfamily, putative [Plasmodium gallinaceum]